MDAYNSFKHLKEKAVLIFLLAIRLYLCDVKIIITPNRFKLVHKKRDAAARIANITKENLKGWGYAALDCYLSDL